MQTFDATQIDWWLIANPTAMGGEAINQFKHIKNLFNTKGWSVKWKESEYAGHAMELAAEGYRLGFRHFIALGGDGTAHELINGLSRCAPDWNTLHFTLLPAGTGNDWIKNWNIPRAPEEWMHRMKQAKNAKIYPAEVAYTDDEGSSQQRYFFNALSAGFGGEVMHRLSRKDKQNPHWIITTFIHWINAVLGGLSGGLIPPLKFPRSSRTKWSYFTTLLQSLFLFRRPEVIIRRNGSEVQTTLYTLEVCKGRYLGGGMYLGPHADPTAEELAITEAIELGLFEVLFNLPKLYNGTLCKLSKVSCYHTKHMILTPLNGARVRIEADGEYLGVAPFSVRGCKTYINFIHP